MRSHAEQMRPDPARDPHLYAVLLTAMADDWEAGGPVREIWRGSEDAPPGSVVQLRLLAGLFRIVLTGRAPELVGFYPCMGGERRAIEAWPVVRPVLGTFTAELRHALDVAPQTNEVARSSALLVGIFDAVHRSGLSRVRLLEPGASAGLNLLLDHFRFEQSRFEQSRFEQSRFGQSLFGQSLCRPSFSEPSGGGTRWSFGPDDSPVVLGDPVAGSVTPVPFTVVSRRGCDLSPVNARAEEGRLRLRSFVWPFQVERHRRLTAALEIAATHRVDVDAAPAGGWLEAQLAADAGPGVLTVVWHSISQLYWSRAEVARVEAAIAAARERFPLAHVSMEYPAGTEESAPGEPELVVSGPGPGQARRLGTVGDHGWPVRLEVPVGGPA
jgi:hypothetical protein